MALESDEEIDQELYPLSDTNPNEEHANSNHNSSCASTLPHTSRRRDYFNSNPSAALSQPLPASSLLCVAFDASQASDYSRGDALIHKHDRQLIHGENESLQALDDSSFVSASLSNSNPAGRGRNIANEVALPPPISNKDPLKPLSPLPSATPPQRTPVPSPSIPDHPQGQLLLQNEQRAKSWSGSILGSNRFTNRSPKGSYSGCLLENGINDGAASDSTFSERASGVYSRSSSRSEGLRVGDVKKNGPSPRDQNAISPNGHRCVHVKDNRDLIQLGVSTVKNFPATTTKKPCIRRGNSGWREDTSAGAACAIHRDCHDAEVAAQDDFHDDGSNIRRENLIRGDDSVQYHPGDRGQSKCQVSASRLGCQAKESQSSFPGDNGTKLYDGRFTKKPHSADSSSSTSSFFSSKSGSSSCSTSSSGGLALPQCHHIDINKETSNLDDGEDLNDSMMTAINIGRAQRVVGTEGVDSFDNGSHRSGHPAKDFEHESKSNRSPVSSRGILGEKLEEKEKISDKRGDFTRYCETKDETIDYGVDNAGERAESDFHPPSRGLSFRNDGQSYPAPDDGEGFDGRKKESKQWSMGSGFIGSSGILAIGKKISGASNMDFGDSGSTTSEPGYGGCSGGNKGSSGHDIGDSGKGKASLSSSHKIPWWRGQKAFQYYKEVFVGLGGVTAVLVISTFAFGSIAAGILSLFSFLSLAFAHLDRRPASYMLSGLMTFSLSVLLCMVVSKTVAGFEVFMKDELLSRLAISHTPFLLITTILSFFLAWETRIRQKRMKGFKSHEYRTFNQSSRLNKENDTRQDSRANSLRQNERMDAPRNQHHYQQYHLHEGQHQFPSSEAGRNSVGTVVGSLGRGNSSINEKRFNRQNAIDKFQGVTCRDSIGEGNRSPVRRAHSLCEPPRLSPSSSLSHNFSNKTDNSDRYQNHYMHSQLQYNTHVQSPHERKMYLDNAIHSNDNCRSSEYPKFGVSNDDERIGARFSPSSSLSRAQHPQSVMQKQQFQGGPAR